MYDNTKKRLIGRVIQSVTVSEDKEKLTILFHGDPQVMKFEVEADCCSSTWIEHLEQPIDVDGATVLSVEEDASVDGPSDDRLEVIQIYKTRINTDRGTIAIEYRNSSNGYYGGSIEEVGNRYGDDDVDV